MRRQDRTASAFDETILPSSPAGPSGEHQIFNLVRAVAASLGFAMSAGWDWLPSMHRLWLRDFIEAADQPGPLGFFGTLPGSIVFKIVMLLVLYPVMERLFMAFPPERVGPSAAAPGNPLPPFIGERIYLTFPLLLAQLTALLLLALLTLYLPPSLYELTPWLLGTISALFGLSWFALLVLLPGVWSCIAYGLAVGFSIFFSLLLGSVPLEALPSFRMLLPALAIPLLLFAMPPTAEIRTRVRRHELHRRFSATMRVCLLRDLLLRRRPLADIFSRQGSVYLVLFMFPLMYGFQLLVDFSSGCPFVCLDRLVDPPLERHAFLILSGEMSGAFLASSLFAFFPRHALLVPMLGLALFGVGSLLTTVLPAPPLNSIAFYLMQLASGCCAAFGLFLVHQFFQRSSFLFRNLSRALVLLTLYGSVGGAMLWSLAENIRNTYLTSHALFMLLLTLGSIVGLFFVYLIRRPLRELLTDKAAYNPPFGNALLSLPPPDPFESLTPREREVAELVQTGMKNLEISVKLNITETTLRVHLRRIYRKLGIRGRRNLRAFNT